MFPQIFPEPTNCEAAPGGVFWGSDQKNICQRYLPRTMAEDFKKVLTDSLKDGQRMIKGGGQTGFSEKFDVCHQCVAVLMVEIMFSQGI